jgi:molybdenum cofactor biosynthesis enzyme MoaA
MNKNLPENACVYPFKAAMLMHGTPPTPCCRFHDRFLSPADKESINTYDPLFSDIRDTMMRNEWHPGCYKCKADEETKGSSMRTEADQFFDDFSNEPRLEYLEITVGRLCNLKCQTCGPEYSHSWDEDFLKIHHNNFYSRDIVSKQQKEQELNLDAIDVDTLKDLKHIKVTGGEPFLHKKFMNFIVRLSNSGLAPNIHIEIFTNCTWWPKKVEYDALMQFKNITISASIDAYGKLNDMIRYPSNWENVETTLDKWLLFKEEYPDKVNVNIACTISIMNVLYLFEFIVWARNVKHVNNVILQTVYEPNNLSITHWPDWFKLKLLDAFRYQYNEIVINSNRVNKMKKLIEDLCSTDTKSDIDNSAKYLAELKHVWKIRGFTFNEPCIRRLKTLCESQYDTSIEYIPYK